MTKTRLPQRKADAGSDAMLGALLTPAYIRHISHSAMYMWAEACIIVQGDTVVGERGRGS